MSVAAARFQFAEASQTLAMVNMALAEAGDAGVATLQNQTVYLPPTPAGYRAGALVALRLKADVEMTCLPCWLAQDPTCGRVSAAEADALTVCSNRAES